MPPTAVDVRVRGSSGALNRIAAGELVAVLDLDRRERVDGCSISAVLTFAAPFGVDVVQVNPSTWRWPSSLRKQGCAGCPRVEGDPADGFVVGTVTAEPPTVEVLGPVACLQMTQAMTEPVTVTGASAPLDRDREHRRRGFRSCVCGHRKRPGSASSSRPRPLSGRSAQLRSRGVIARGQVQVLPSDITAWVRGPREAITSDADMFDATVDVEGLEPGQFQLPVSIVAPARVGVVRTRTGGGEGSHPVTGSRVRRWGFARTSVRGKMGRLFGTDGVRGKAGEYPLDVADVRRRRRCARPRIAADNGRRAFPLGPRHA